jgi:glycine dehydrogenase subunit 1
VIDALIDREIMGGVPASRLYPEIPELDRLLIVAATETNTDTELDVYASELERVLA